MGHAKGALNNFSMPIYLKISNFEESNPLLWMDQYRGSSTVAGFFFVQRFFLPLSLSLSQMAFRQKPCHSGKWHLPKNLRRSLVWGSDTQFALSCPIIWQWQGNSQHLSRAGPSKASLKSFNIKPKFIIYSRTVLCRGSPDACFVGWPSSSRVGPRADFNILVNHQVKNLLTNLLVIV